MLKDTLLSCGLIAILRGIRADEVVDIANALYEEGFRAIEVPLNSPAAHTSIHAMRMALPQDCIVGAGTVYRPEQVTEVKECGGEFIVMPHSDPAVIEAAQANQLEVMPGVATPNEAFAAYHMGATLLKVFPVENLGPSTLKAWLSVLPNDISLIPVGGITPLNLASFTFPRVAGFGIGSALYKPDVREAEVRQRARDFVDAWRNVIGDGRQENI